MNIASPLVTIAIPVYKSRFLRQAIQSAINQTYRNIEIVIVNDASPENVDEIVSSFEDRRIKYFTNETNIGGQDPAENWNKCLEHASGEFFALLCDDDVYEDFFIDEMIGLWRNNPEISVFRSRVKMVDADNNIIDLYPSSPSWESAMDYLWSKVSRNRIQTISEFLIKTDRIKSCGGYINMPKAWCADEMSILTFAKEGGIAHSNKLCVSFRMSGENISSNNSKDTIAKIEAQLLYTNWIKEFIKEEQKWFQDSVLFHRSNCLSICISEYLQYASLKDFVYLIFHRKDYQILWFYFIKALVSRVAKFIK